MNLLSRRATACRRKLAKALSTPRWINGSGRLVVTVEPNQSLTALDLLERGADGERRATALVARH
jgi:hypothetical protein